MNKYLSSPFLRNEKTIILNTSTVEDFNKISTIALSISLLASCQPSYAEVGKSLFGGNSDFVQELNKINQLSFIDGFNCLDLVAVTGNNEILSKSTSVSPLRHRGFFAPIVYAVSQAAKQCVKMTMAHLRPKSVYDWMTRPNKPMANKSGGSSRPRVNPVALISQLSATYNNSKLLGI